VNLKIQVDSFNEQDNNNIDTCESKTIKKKKVISDDDKSYSQTHDND